MNESSDARKLPPRRLSGDSVDPLPPSLYPARVAREGRYVLLEPLDPRAHGDDLYTAGHASDEALKIWDYMAYGPWDSLAGFHAWLRAQSASADPLFFAIRDSSRPSFEGIATMMEIRPEPGVIEIGNIWFAPPLQRSRAATEALYSLMTYALDELGYRRLEWKCNALNQGSRNAALRLGFEFEGIFYQHSIPKGKNRDTAWYSILDYEWPLIRENFERWLAPANFDDGGKQRESLGDMNRALRAS